MQRMMLGCCGAAKARFKKPETRRQIDFIGILNRMGSRIRLLQQGYFQNQLSRLSVQEDRDHSLHHYPRSRTNSSRPSPRWDPAHPPPRHRTITISVVCQPCRMRRSAEFSSRRHPGCRRASRVRGANLRFAAPRPGGAGSSWLHFGILAGCVQIGGILSVRFHSAKSVFAFLSDRRQSSLPP